MNIVSSTVYLISGAAGLIIGLSKQFRSLPALGLVLVALGTLNAYAENWRKLQGFRFFPTEIILLALFLSAYVFFSTKLILSKFEVPISKAVLASASHTFVAWFIALSYICFLVRSSENPPFAVLLFLSLICVLHVPMFATFKKRVTTLVEPGRKSDTLTGRPASVRPALILIVIPFLSATAFQFAGTGDWRMIIPNGLVCGSAWSLTIIAHSEESILQRRHLLSGPFSKTGHS